MRRISSLLVAGFLLLGQSVLAQRPATAPSKAPETGNPPVVAPKTTGPKPYKEVITAKAKTEKGLLITHTLDDKYFFEIIFNFCGTSFFGQDFIFFGRKFNSPKN